MATPALPTPTPDELDDLIYFSRTGDLPSLQTTITDLCQRHACTPSTLLASAIDIDASGMGSQSTLLHFAAANNHVMTLQYLLGLISPAPTQQNGISANISATVEDKSVASLVDHRNASGNTALHWGAMNGHLDVVKVLVEEGGADVGVLNRAGQDALFVAEVSGMEGGVLCAEWLLKHGVGLERGIGGEGETVAETEAETEEEGETIEKAETEDKDAVEDLASGVERARVADGG